MSRLNGFRSHRQALMFTSSFPPTMEPKSEVEYAADGLKFHLSFVLHPTDNLKKHS